MNLHYHKLDSVLVKCSTAVAKHYDEYKLEEEEINFILQLVLLYPVMLYNELKEET